MFQHPITPIDPGIIPRLARVALRLIAVGHRRVVEARRVDGHVVGAGLGRDTEARRVPVHRGVVPPIAVADRRAALVAAAEHALHAEVEPARGRAVGDAQAIGERAGRAHGEARAAVDGLGCGEIGERRREGGEEKCVKRRGS